MSNPGNENTRRLFCSGYFFVIKAKALSARIGMNQSLLAQYINGIKKPSPKQTIRIMEGARTLGRELADIEFLM